MSTAKKKRRENVGVAHVGTRPWTCRGAASLLHVDHNVMRSILALLSNEDVFSCFATCRFLYGDARHVLCSRAVANFGVPDPMALVAETLSPKRGYWFDSEKKDLAQLFCPSKEKAREIDSRFSGCFLSRAITLCIQQYGSVSAMIASSRRRLVTAEEKIAYAVVYVKMATRFDDVFLEALEEAINKCERADSQSLKELFHVLRRTRSHHAWLRQELDSIPRDPSMDMELDSHMCILLLQFLVINQYSRKKVAQYLRKHAEKWGTQATGRRHAAQIREKVSIRIGGLCARED